MLWSLNPATYLLIICSGKEDHVFEPIGVKLVSIGLSMLIACNSLIAQVGRVAYSFRYC
jgi:hypothetical protein